MFTRSEYPKEVHIGEVTYRVRFVNKLDHELTLGECDPGDLEIRIKKGQSREDTFKTFIHEMIHAVFDEAEIPIKHKHVYKLEEFLFDFIQKNSIGDRPKR